VFHSFPAWLGVDLFFLISGFLITTLLLREERETGGIDLWAFYVRRFFRIVPVYSLILALYFVTAAFNRHRWRLMAHYAWYYLTLSGEFIKLLPYDSHNVAPFGATWTLGIEEKFYLIWPVLFFVLLPRRKRNFIIPILVLLVSPLPSFWMFRSYFGLLLGCTMAILLSHNGFVQFKSIVSRMPPVALITIVAIGFYAVGKNWRFVFLFDVAGVLFLSSLVLAKNWMTAFLSSAPMAWLGRRSYSMYLVHTLALDIVEHFVHSRSVLMTATIVLLAVAVAAAGATLLYHFVEEPARIYGKCWLARRSHTPRSISPAVALADTATNLQG
jgi:peptidoglycan/LPS O-acetylase OafA/YrhL